MIKGIKLTNFRCHTDFALEFQPDTTLILGPNGYGKTSVLEAIYLLIQGKSFRAPDKEILKYETAFYRAELDYENGEKVAVDYADNKRRFTVEDRKTANLPSKMRHPVVLFEPKDLNLISLSGTERRKYFDRFFSQLSHEYATALSRYDKALTQRNKLLKDEYASPDQLFPWNVMLARNGLFLTRNRKALVEKINAKLNQVYYSIAENDDTIRLCYSTDVSLESEDNESIFLAELEKNYEKDRIVGYTTFGSHRERIDFIFNEVEADGSASRGETRSVILALKFIEAKLLEAILHEKPLILLDDVFSELDTTRRQALVNNFKDHQVVITSVEKVVE